MRGNRSGLGWELCRMPFMNRQLQSKTRLRQLQNRLKPREARSDIIRGIVLDLLLSPSRRSHRSLLLAQTLLLLSAGKGMPSKYVRCLRDLRDQSQRSIGCCKDGVDKNSDCKRYNKHFRAPKQPESSLAQW